VFGTATSIVPPSEIKTGQEELDYTF